MKDKLVAIKDPKLDIFTLLQDALIDRHIGTNKSVAVLSYLLSKYESKNIIIAKTLSAFYLNTKAKQDDITNGFVRVRIFDLLKKALTSPKLLDNNSIFVKEFMENLFLAEDNKASFNQFLNSINDGIIKGIDSYTEMLRIIKEHIGNTEDSYSYGSSELYIAIIEARDQPDVISENNLPLDLSLEDLPAEVISEEILEQTALPKDTKLEDDLTLQDKAPLEDISFDNDLSLIDELPKEQSFEEESPKDTKLEDDLTLLDEAPLEDIGFDNDLSLVDELPKKHK